MNLNLVNNQKGLTLVELAAAITVVSIALIGLSVGFLNISMQHAQEIVRNDLLNYANSFATSIIREIYRADYIELSNNNGFKSIDYWREDDLVPYMTITGSRDGGFVVEPENIRLSNKRLPNYGESFNKGLRSIELIEFDILENNDIIPGLSKFNKAMNTLYLAFEVKSKASISGNEISEMIFVDRSFFRPRKYIELKTQRSKL
ncbi:MAG: prepilin-type N-terminal cleavage/methylation domain-containing protein [Candidatus Marinimicrobia bacterium]|nr:prepilin-type N-terminal cleavage/methylation domain-containing protein [Candidatus Neomarinimicrobiota bacterium]